VKSISRLCIAVSLLVAAPAQAGPTLWERVPLASAKVDPEYAHREAAKLVYDADRGGGVLGTFGGQAIVKLHAARDLLELAGARKSKDVRLTFDLGRVLSRLRECKDATAVLESAIAISPKNVQASTAWFDIGICAALDEDHVREEKAYVAALELEESPEVRATIHSNLAESRMALGKMTLALESIETALDLMPDAMLPWWTLAIVRDRSGDSAGALTAARVAISYDPNYLMLDGPGVFFAPEYDREWYHGLGELAHYEVGGGSVEEQKVHLMKALVHFRLYVEAAPPTDRFRALGQEHVDSLEKRMGLKKK